MTNFESTNEHEEYFTISVEGEVSLADAYRGNGVEEYPASLRGNENPQQLLLPNRLVIPKKVGETSVRTLAPGMFYGNQNLIEVELPSTVTTIPKAFCCEATNLQTIHTDGSITTIGASAFKSTKIKEAVFPELTSLGEYAFSNCAYLKNADIGSVIEIPAGAFENCVLLREVSNTENIAKIGKFAFSSTRIKHAPFTSLTSLGVMAFSDCAYLETANIGTVREIPAAAFGNCALLREVIGKKVVSIGKQAFFNTRSLRDLPLLSHVTHVDEDAFYHSRLCTSLPANEWINSKAFPTGDNNTDFWSGVKFTPRRNRLTTKLSQLNHAWWEDTFLSDPEYIKENFPYSNACAIFAVMHIHSALSGKYYSHPEQFVSELRSNPNLSEFLYYNNWPGQFENVAPMFEALGYRAEVRGNGTNLSKDDYRALVDALAHGAYIYAQVPTYKNWEDGKYDQGHAVVIYGINELGEVCVLDSNVLHEPFRDGGFEPGIDVYTYTMPYQNMVGPGSDFVIVYPTKEDPDVKWTGSDALNAFTSASRPSEYPESRVTVCRVTHDKGTPSSENGILTACRVGHLAYRTFMPDGKADLYVQVKSLGENDDKWLDWRPCNRKNFSVLENRILSGTRPFELPIGINASVVDVEAEYDQLPEKKRGCLTSYHLFYDPAYAREEWQPDGSENTYVRHATDRNQWGKWYVFTSQAYTSETEDTSGEEQ